MKPVMQTATGPTGNCMAACLASVLELPLAAVPNFFENAGDDDSVCWNNLRAWLATLGLGIITLTFESPAQWKHLRLSGFHIVGGKSPRGFDHATVWEKGQMIHDPHPEGGGLVKPEVLDLIYVLDPMRLIRLKPAKVNPDGVAWDEPPSSADGSGVQASDVPQGYKAVPLKQLAKIAGWLDAEWGEEDLPRVLNRVRDEFAKLRNAGVALPALQGGLTNDELRVAFKAKLPKVEPTERDLTMFALGIEAGSSIGGVRVDGDCRACGGSGCKHCDARGVPVSINVQAEVGAELERRTSGVPACGSNGTVDCQSTAPEHRCAACPHGVLGTVKASDGGPKK